MSEQVLEIQPFELTVAPELLTDQDVATRFEELVGDLEAAVDPELREALDMQSVPGKRYNAFDSNDRFETV